MLFLEPFFLHFLTLVISVSDPSHFDVDPDPDILGPTFGKSGSGSSDPPFRNSGSRSGFKVDQEE